MRKSQTTAFLLLLFYIGKLIFSQKTYLEKKQVIGSAVTPTPMQIFIGFVDAILRSKILCNRLRILTQILIAMDNFIYIFQTSTFDLGKKIILIWAINFIIKSLTKGIKVLPKRLFSFSIIVAIQHEASGYTFYKEIKHLLCNIFASPHTSNRTQLVQNCFSNYVYLKDVYITLKGIGKILFVSMLRILIICKFLNFTATFPKKLNFSKFAFNFPADKVNFSLIHRTHSTIHNF